MPTVRMAPSELLGDWRFFRSIDDRVTRQRLRAHGTLTLDWVPTTRTTERCIDWVEVGQLELPSGVVPVSRRYVVAPRAHGWMVTFADGRDFHPWVVEGEVAHQCGADTYTGSITIMNATIWQIRWTCRGPAKDYTIDTCIRRA